ncbi:MAG: EH signature domain-containing protein [Gallionella sp.]
MDVLNKLQRVLRTTNRVTLARMRPGDSLQMFEERAKLQAWVKGTSTLEGAPLATIEDALRVFRQNKYLKGVRQIRLVCYGCTQVSEGCRVIESGEAFKTLLGNVERYRDKRRTFRKLYRALLSSYFSYDTQASDANLAGKKNSEALRRFLARHSEDFVMNEFTPDWLAALINYPELLSEYPSLSLQVSEGDWSIFEEIRERLELDSGSWLVKQLVMAPIRATPGMKDVIFKAQLDRILLLLTDYPLFVDAGLKVLLDRYAQCRDPAIHTGLRDFSIEHWGNPWLVDNAPQWQCGARAREMLAYWLKRELLRGFFELLSNDDQTHSRRRNFWDLYSADMTGIYFALGRDAYAANKMSLYRFRRHAKGLLAKLTDEKYGVHSCIMQFSHHHVVEFNRENNVAYFYDVSKGTPAFYLGKGWLEIGAIGVQAITEGANIARDSRQIRHQDSKQLTWEGKFSQELGATDNVIKAFCAKYQCDYEGLRNGKQWIRPAHIEQYGSEVWSVLQGWGFDFSEEDNAYIKS